MMISNGHDLIHKVLFDYLGETWKVQEQAYVNPMDHKFSIYTELTLDRMEIRRPGFDLYRYLIPKLREKLMETKVVSHYVSQLEDEIEKLKAENEKLRKYETHFQMEKELRK